MFQATSLTLLPWVFAAGLMGIFAVDDESMAKDNKEKKDQTTAADEKAGKDDEGGFGSERNAKKMAKVKKLVDKKSGKKAAEDAGDESSAAESKEVEKLRRELDKRLGRKDDVIAVFTTTTITYEKDDYQTEAGGDAGFGAGAGRNLPQGRQLAERGLVAGGGNQNWRNGPGGNATAPDPYGAPPGYFSVVKQEVHRIEGKDAAIDTIVKFMGDYVATQIANSKAKRKSRRDREAATAPPTPVKQWELLGLVANNEQGKIQADNLYERGMKGKEKIEWKMRDAESARKKR